MMLGVPALSWALWAARALDLPFTSYAANGATAADVLELQLPRVRADYDVGCLYAGVNDVRAPGWDAAAYERDLRAILAGLAARAARLLVLSPPHDLGRPTSAPKPERAAQIIGRVAVDHGAAVADLADLRGWPRMLPDAVHPTAIGQLEIADRAARALGAAVAPSALAGLRITAGGLVRSAPAYAGALSRDLARRGRERLLPPS